MNSEWAFFGKIADKGNYGEVLWKGDGKVLVKGVDYILGVDIAKGYTLLLDDANVIICASKEEARKISDAWFMDTSNDRARITVAENSINSKWEKLKRLNKKEFPGIKDGSNECQE